MKRLITVVLFTLATLSLEAQIQVDPIPTTPVAGHFFLIQFRSYVIVELRSVTRTGDHFAFVFEPCQITCPEQTLEVPMPALPEGAYTYEIRIDDYVADTGSFSVGPALYGQILVEVLPASPRAGNNVFLRFFNPNILDDYTVEREGRHFRFRFGSCHVTCISVPNVELGQLAEGTYTYEVLIDDVLAGNGFFAVAAAPAPVPALSPGMLGALSAALMFAGTFWLGRRG